MGFKFIKPVTESQLQASIQGERDTAYKESVGAAIQDEVEERIACDTAIIAAYTDADNVINSRLAAETSARQTETADIRNNFQAADTDIKASLAAESAARRDGDDSLNEKLGLQSVQLTNLGTSLDTTAAALGNETDNRTEQFKTVGDALNAEINARAAADNVLQASIGSINDRLSADSTISGALANEISNRENQIASLSSAISAETSQRKAADDSLSAAIQSEKTARINGDTSLKSIFDTAVADYKNADSTLKSFVDNAVTNLLASDTKILTALNSEVTLRAGQTSSLASALNAETNLQAQHYTELVNGLAALNTALSTEKTTRGNADETLRKSINNAIDQLNAFYQDFSKRVPIPPESEDSDTVYYLTNRGWGEPIETRIKIGATPAQVNVPYYSGKVITPQFDNYNPEALTVSSEATATNAGTYTIVFTPNEGFMWADGTQDPRRVTWKILPAVVSVPTADKTSFEYNGGNIILPVSGYDSDCSTQTGTANATAVGNYTAKYELKSTQNYIWSDNTTAPKTIGWKVTVKSIAKPTITNTTFDYDGNNHAPTITGYAADYMSQDGSTSSTNAGNFTVTYSLKDKVNTQWAGGGTGDVTLNWVINRKKLTAAQSTGFAQTNTLYYNNYWFFNLSNWIVRPGDYMSPAISNFDKNLHSVSGNLSEWISSAGNYTAKVTPSNNYTWADGTVTAIDVPWKVQTAVLPKPTFENTAIEYTGSTINVVISNYDIAVTRATKSSLKPKNATPALNQVLMSGTTSATNVGTYGITFSLAKASSNHGLENITWEDGTTDDVTLTWKIVQGAGIAKPTLNATSFEWTGGNIAPTINGFNSNTMTKTGSESGTDINSYKITVALKDKVNTSWADGSTADVVLTWNITKRTLTKPVINWSSFDYDGHIKSNGTDGYNQIYMDRSGTLNATNAGTYTVTISLKNTTTCQWVGGGTANVVLNWVINRQKLSAAQSTFSQSGTLTYNGNSQSVSISGYNSTYHDLSSETSATNAGTYTAKIAPKSNYCFSDGSTSAKTVNWSIGKLSLTQPTLTNTTYTYDGNKHSPTINNFNSTYENQTGNTDTATAGTYTVTFSLKDTNNTCWQGGSTANVERTWTINKATPTLTKLTDINIADNAGIPLLKNGSQYSYNGDGQITVSVVSEENLITLDQLGTGINEYWVRCDGYSSGTITVQAAEGTNYKSSGSIQIPVNSTKLRRFNLCTMNEIKRVIKAGKAESAWAVGDHKYLYFKPNSYFGSGTTSRSLQFKIVIIDFWNETNKYSEEVDCGIELIIVGNDYINSPLLPATSYGQQVLNPTAGDYCMNYGNSNPTLRSFGYHFRKTIWPAFEAALPDELKNVCAVCFQNNSPNSGGDGTWHFTTLPSRLTFMSTNTTACAYIKNGNTIGEGEKFWSFDYFSDSGGESYYYIYNKNDDYKMATNAISGTYSLGLVFECRILDYD